MRGLTGLVLLLVIVFSSANVFPSIALGGQMPRYTEYWIGGLRVILVNPRTPDLVIRYKGVNYVDFNTSNDYATYGPRCIPGLNMAGNASSINSTILSKVIRRVAVYLEPGDMAGGPVGMDYPVVVHRDYSAVEVVVKPDKDPVESSMAIARALEPLLLRNNYTTLIIVRGLSEAPFTRLLGAAGSVNHAIEILVDGNYSGNPPVYLQRIAENIRRNPDRLYISVGTGVYGSVVVDIWGPKPGKAEVYNIVKWIRDSTPGNNSDIPLYIIFHSGHPPKLALMTYTVTRSETPLGTSPSISYTSTSILLTVGLAIMLMGAVILKGNIGQGYVNTRVRSRLV